LLVFYRPAVLCEMQAAVKRAAPLAVGVGTAAAAAAGSSTAECHSTVVVTKEQLEDACALIKNDLSKGQAIQGDASPWIMTKSDSHDFDLLELSASVAADPTVQKVLKEKYEQQGLSSLSIESWPSSCSSSPAFSLLLDGGIELETENERLKEENERLKHENARLRHDREANPLHSAARPEPAPEAAAPKAVATEAAAPKAAAPEAAAPEAAAPEAVAVLRLHLQDGGRIRARLGTQEVEEAGPRPRKSQRAKERQRKAVIVATAIVVGLLAITITKNPNNAKVAAASAAAAVTSLMSTYARNK